MLCGGKWVSMLINIQAIADYLGVHQFPATYSKALNVGRLPSSGTRTCSSSCFRSSNLWRVVGILVNRDAIEYDAS